MKAERLAVLRDAGFAVPRFVALSAGDELTASTIAWIRDELGDGPLAVRSSGIEEDLADASFAGMYDTVLDVIGDEALATAIESVRGSGSGERVRAYRSDVAVGPIGVMVQQMLRCDFGGVAFSHGPAGDAETATVVAVAGSPEPLVAGRASGESWRIRHQGWAAASETDEVELSAGLAAEVARLAVSVAEHFGEAQEIEWGYESGRLWLLQARPITAVDGTDLEACGGSDGEVLATGTAASPGVVSGTVRVVMNVDDLSAVLAGEILVAPTTEPSWTPVFGIVAAVVTDVGSLAAHAAVVAREFGIPAVVGTVDGTTRLRTGDRVTVDGAAGEVYRLSDGPLRPPPRRASG
ncbi:MAG: hypothetical protein IT195_01515 [Microthrixaceae bacterium]|nr:hypothetical protein [Microthrixaceae bacterium]